MFKEIGHFEAFNRLYLGDKNIYHKTKEGQYMWVASPSESLGGNTVVVWKDSQYYRKIAEVTYEAALRAYLDGKIVVSFRRDDSYNNQEEGTEETYSRPKDWMEKGFLPSLPYRLRGYASEAYIFFVE